MASDLSVLIVDDDPRGLQLLQALVEDAGFQVTTTERPRGALAHVQATPPDILITDLRMPEMSGLDLVRAVHQVNPEIYCLLVTGFASDESTTEAYRAGVRDLLLKPINVVEVRVRLQNAAEIVRLRRELRALRARGRVAAADSPGSLAAPRAHELANLPALPGSAGPVDVAGWDESLHRLERLRSLYRQGIIDATEFEEKKRTLLARLESAPSAGRSRSAFESAPTRMRGQGSLSD
jgi:CheY-like chemotaxis protein